MSIPRPLVILVVASLLLAGCGIAFGEAKKGNEFFDSLDVTGDMRANEHLTAAVAMRQNYPVEVTVACELRQASEKVKDIGREVVPAFPNGSPELTPFPANFSFDFTVDEPGSYKVDCFTPLDDDNYIREEIVIGPAAEATPTPIGGEIDVP